MNSYYVKESDWELYKKYVPLWQERYIDKLNKEYISILSRDDIPSTNFWDVCDRINKDKNHPGVIINKRRSTMFLNISIMLRDGVITMDDLSEFSEELKDSLMNE